jgi:hypothetical protein
MPIWLVCQITEMAQHFDNLLCCSDTLGFGQRIRDQDVFARRRQAPEPLTVDFAKSEVS